MYHNTLAWILSLAGLLPVIATCVWAYYQGVDSQIMLVVLQYLGIIQAFLAGTSWAFSLSSPQFAWGLVYAVSFALLPWFASMQSIFIRLILACVGFIGLLIFDYLLLRKQVISTWYFSLRVLITIIMITLLLLIMALI